MSRVAIVGGGISGLSAAYYLTKIPHQEIQKIVVLEGSKRFGGWMHTTRFEDGSLFEHGPRSFQVHGNTIKLVEELGLAEDIISVSRTHSSAKNRFIYYNDTLHKLPNSLSSIFWTQSPFSSPLIYNVLAEIFFRKKRRDDDTIHNILEQRMGTEFANLLISAVFRGIYAGDTKKLSLKSCNPSLYDAIKNHGSLIAGILKSRKSDEARSMQALIRESPLMMKMYQDKVTTWSFQKGTQQLIDRLLEVLSENQRVELRSESPCTKLQFTEEGVNVATVDETMTFDHVISSVFSKDLASMLPEEHSTLASNLKKIKAVTCVVVNLEFPEKQDIPQGFGHLLPASEDGPVLGVVYDSCCFTSHNRIDQDSTRLTVMVGGQWFDELKERVGRLDDDSLTKFALDIVKKQLGISCKPSKVIVSIQKDCIPQYLVGHSDLLDDLFDYIKKNKLPLTLIGSSYKAVAVNNCIANAKDGAQHAVSTLKFSQMSRNVVE